MDDLAKAAQAAQLAAQSAEAVAESGVQSQKDAATTVKVAAGFSILASILTAFKSIFGKK